MRVGMAGSTRRGLREEGFGRVFVLNQGAQLGEHVCRRMTFFALQVGVLALQLVTSQSVIEFFFGRFPVDQVEILAVVLQMAPNAIFAVRIFHLHLGVISMLIGEGFGNFCHRVGITALQQVIDGCRKRSA